MPGLILIGAFHELEEICALSGVDLIGTIDRDKPKNSSAFYLGDDSVAAPVLAQHADAFVHIVPDQPNIRRKLWHKYEAMGCRFLTLCHPSAVVSASAKIGDGCVIQASVTISAASSLGKGVKVNTGATLTHDVQVADFVTIAPRAVLCGDCKIGEGAYIGANATILGGIRIGAGAIIGAGAVVTRDVPEQATMIGNPARIKETNE